MTEEEFYDGLDLLLRRLFFAAAGLSAAAAGVAAAGCFLGR